MTLADAIATDLPTFLNVGEFASLRTIDGGYPVACDLQAIAAVEHRAEGVFARDAVLHIRAEDLDAVPVVTQRMTIDGAPYDVLAVAENMGMLSINLRRLDS